MCFGPGVRYNPSNFNATEMAVLAKQAGFQYIFYTTVHCDGFINWDTKLTDYNIMNTPYGKDIFGEVWQSALPVLVCVRVDRTLPG